MKDERIALENKYRRETVRSRENAVLDLHHLTGFDKDAIDFDLGHQSRVNIHEKTLRLAVSGLSENVKLMKLRSYRAYSDRLLLYSELVRQIAIEFDTACEQVIRKDVFGHKGIKVL